MSHSYKEFPSEVLTAYADLIEKHNLHVEVEGDYRVKLRNEFVCISYGFDRGDLFSVVQKNGDHYKFAIWQIRKFLLPTISKKKTPEKYPAAIIRSEAELFRNELNPILSGDFHWYDDLKAEKEYEKSLISVILGPEMDYHHPISQKFWKLDKSWRTDIEEYVKVNKIKLNVQHSDNQAKTLEEE